MEVKRHCKYFAFLIVLICISVMFSFKEEATDKKNYINTREYVLNIVKMCSEWMEASSKDVSPLMRNMHSNYAVSLFFALKKAVDDETIVKILKDEGYNLQELRDMAIKFQEFSVKELMSNCKRLNPSVQKENKRQEKTSTLKQSFTPIAQYRIRR